MKKIFIACLFLLIEVSAYADIGIVAGKIEIKNITSPSLNVLCNQVDSTIIIDRAEYDNLGVSAGWSSILSPHTCSVFFSDKSAFVFACSEQSFGGLNRVDCKKDLLVGPLTWSGKMLAGKKVTGSYWVAESISVEDVTLVARHRGFDL